MQVWANEYNGTKNWFALPKEVQKQIMKKKLNSSEFQYFRTAAGRIVMALSNYSELKSSIANWLNESDLTTEIAEDFIVLAEKILIQN